MDFSNGLDIREIHRWLVMVWLVVGAPLVLAALPVPALEPLRKLFLPLMRRGKLLRSDEPNRKGLQRFTVPQSFFTHFYVVGLIWTTVLFFTSLGFAVSCSSPAPEEHKLSSLASQLVEDMLADISGGYSTGATNVCSKESWRLVFLLLLFQIHLTRRLYESVFVSIYDPSARMTFPGYIIALGYYTAVPLTLFIQSFGEESYTNAFKSFLKQKLLGHNHGLQVTDTPNTWDMMYFLGRFGWLQYLGAVVCLYAAVHQNKCHDILAALRVDPKSGESTSYKYGIPRGDWFEYVSSAHYLAEIVFYVGLLIASGGDSPEMWILFVTVVANLYLLAKPTHEWYHSHFKHYPKSRHALFPSFNQIRSKKD